MIKRHSQLPQFSIYRHNAVWCLLGKNNQEYFVVEAKRQQNFVRPNFSIYALYQTACAKCLYCTNEFKAKM